MIFGAHASRFPSLKRVLPALVLIANAIVGIEDIFEDRAMGLSISHYGAEAVVSLIGILTALWLMSEVGRARRNVTVLASHLENSRAVHERLKQDLNHYRSETSRLAAGLGRAIENQLVRWGLTEAEIEVALLLLRGLSTKEIAVARDVSDRTIRQQTVAIYEKSALGGRAALSGFFLKDLCGEQGLRMREARESVSR